MFSSLWKYYRRKGWKKGILCCFISVSLILPSGMVSYANENERVSLKDMTKEECYQTLLDNGLTVPESFENYSDIPGFVKNIVDAVIKHPDCTSWYNFEDSQEFAMAIRNCVLDYENIREYSMSDMISLSVSASSSLKYSTLVGTWDDSYLYYNCYAYAVNKAAKGRIDPGCTLSDYSMKQSDLETMTIDRLVWFVTYDLKNWGYSDITYSRTRPSYTEGYRVIAVRKCSVDYHFMYLYSSSNVWRHKPATTSILQYNYSSPASGKWTNERIYENILGILVYADATIEYDSDIVYIKYKL